MILLDTKNARIFEGLLPLQKLLLLQLLSSNKAETLNVSSVYMAQV